MSRQPNSRRVDRVAGILRRRAGRERESQIWPLDQPKTSSAASPATARPGSTPARSRSRVRCDDQAWIDEWIAPGTAAPPRGPRDPLLLSVDELDLSVRAGNCLMGSGISTIGELTRMTRKELLRVRWSSAGVARCVIEALAEFGLTLAVDQSYHDHEQEEPSDER